MYNNLKEEQKERAAYQRDEFDLRQVFVSIGNGFRSLSRKTEYIIKLVARNFILVLVCVLIGSAIAYLYYKQQRLYYTSSMTLMLNEIRNDFVEDQLQKLSEMIADGNYAAVASQLDISLEAAQDINSLQFTNLDADRIEEDSILIGAPFVINLSIFNKDLFPTMQTALTDYMETNRYFSKQKQIRENEKRKMITKLRTDIRSIDSVKSAIIAPKGPVNGFIYGEAADPTNLYKESINMYRLQVDLESDLDKLNNVEVINGFAPRLKPAGPKLRYYLLFAGVISLLVALIIADRLEKRRRGV